MMSINTVTGCQAAAAADPLTQTPRGWSEAQATDAAIRQLMAQKFREIVANYDQRKRSARIEDLDRGPWYGNDYAEVLGRHAQQSAGAKRRFDWCVSNNKFYDGLPPEGFAPIKDPQTLTGFSTCGYQIKEGVLPSQAIQKAIEGKPSFIDCQVAVEIAMYLVLREILSDQVFDRLFSATGNTPMILHPNIFKTPLHSLNLFEEVPIDIEKPNFVLGDNLHFSNFPLYKIKHANGEASGFHVVCVRSADDKEIRFIAFGTPPEGLTEGDMLDLLVAEFNKTPINSSSILTPNLAAKVAQSYSNQPAVLSAMIGQPIETFQTNRAHFDEVVRESRERVRSGAPVSSIVGLFPAAKRLNPAEIRSFLK